MKFSEQLEQMVYSTPVVNFQKEKNVEDVQKSTKTKNQQEMLNQLGLAIKRR
jgi:hypothetical protein